MKRISYLFILFLFLRSFIYAQTCSVESASACDVDGGFFSDKEVNKISRQDSSTVINVKKEMSKDGKISLYFFYSYDCPHCKKAYAFLEELKKQYPDLIVYQYEVKKNKGNVVFFKQVAKEYNVIPRGVPAIFVGSKSFTGFAENVTCNSIIKEVHHLQGIHDECKETQIDIPMIGSVNVSTISMPSFTFYMGLLDGLNPCAMWVLMFLLGLMTYAKDRKKIIFLGSVFVVASGLVYFMFMAAWLNLFLVIGYSTVITVILGVVAIFMGLVNIKELFFFKKGISLMIPESAKPKLYKKARAVIYEKNSFFAIIGTVLLAVFVNFIELGCTIGLPAIYTRILSLKSYSSFNTYMYMGLYNIAYIVPLALIVAVFAYTMGHYKFTEKHGRIFKLISGILMLILGVVLILFPELLFFT